MEGFSAALLTALSHDIAPIIPRDEFGVIPDLTILSAKQFACLALQGNIIRKFVPADGNPVADAKAIEKFLAVNERQRVFDFQKDTWGTLEKTVYDQMKYDLFRALNPDGFNYVTLGHAFERLDTGPGASVDASGTTFYHKVGAGPLSTTSDGLYRYYTGAIVGSRTERAETWRRTLGAPLVKGSKLSCVPKNTEVSRTICTEPSLNMMFQKGIGSLLEDVLRDSYGILYRNADEKRLQPAKNVGLAMVGSKDGSFATIDLSSASDSLSLTLIRDLFPRDCVQVLECVRSPSTLLPSGEWIDLHMISSMGNGYTFPLQTLLFSSLVVAVYKTLNIPVHLPRGSCPGNFGVFGDDIICVTEAADLVLSMLGRLGFLPNADKTFVEGPFRESCGADFLNGIDVRPVFVKKMNQVQDVFKIVNLLMEWSWVHNVRLDHTIQYLVSLVPSRLVRFVPFTAAADSGFWSTLRLAQGKGCVKTVLNRDTNAISFLLKKDQANSVELRLADDGSKFLLKGRDARVFVNGHAVMLAFLRGDMRNGYIALRQNSTLYKTRAVLIPGWDNTALTTGRNGLGYEPGMDAWWESHLW
jgi:hypothetical protein